MLEKDVECVCGREKETRCGHEHARFRYRYTGPSPEVQHPFRESRLGFMPSGTRICWIRRNFRPMFHLDHTFLLEPSAMWVRHQTAVGPMAHKKGHKTNHICIHDDCDVMYIQPIPSIPMEVGDLGAKESLWVHMTSLQKTGQHGKQTGFIQDYCLR